MAWIGQSVVRVLTPMNRWNPEHMPPPLPLSVSFDLTKDDLTFFNLYHCAKSPTARRQFRRSLLLPPTIWLVLWFTLVFFAGREDGSWLQKSRNLLPLMLFPPLYVAWLPWAHRRAIRRAIDGMIGEGDNRRLFGQRTVTATPAYISDSGAHGSSSTAWSAVERVVRLDEAILVYTSALSAEVIPRRAFLSAIAFDSFASALEEMRTQGSKRVTGSD